MRLRATKFSDTSEAGFWFAYAPTDRLRLMAEARAQRTRAPRSGGDALCSGGALVSERYRRAGQGRLLVRPFTARRRTGQWRTRRSTWRSAIEYGQNLNEHSSTHHARIELGWQPTLSTCAGSSVPIGAHFTYRSGIRRYEGAKKLLAIRSFVRNTPGAAWTKRREMTLTYSAAAESCSAVHAPLRQLASVQTKAWGPTDPVATPSVVLPATTFVRTPGVRTRRTATPGPRRFRGPERAQQHQARRLADTRQHPHGSRRDGAVEQLSSSLCSALPNAVGNGSSPAGSGAPLTRRAGRAARSPPVTHRATPRNQTVAAAPGCQLRSPGTFTAIDSST
jgi:hypothetical protein